MLISDKEMEALLFVMDDPPLVKDLGRRKGLSDEATTRAVGRLRPFLEGRMLPRDLRPAECLVLAACIEDSDWPACYAEFHPEELEEVHMVLRKLARKIEPIGVHVDRIAHA